MPSTSQLGANSRSMNGLNNISANTVFTDNLEVNNLTIDVIGTAPTRPPFDNSTKIATTAYVETAVSAVGGVSLSGNNVFTGNNTYNTNLPTSTISAISGNQLVNLTTLNSEITTAGTSYAKLATANAFTSTNTFNSFLPTSTILASSANEFTNKNYVDNAISGGSYVTTNTTQSISGAKTFNTNTLTASAGITIKNGASAQTATLTQNATTLNVIGAGDISIKPTNDFNVVTGTGKNITVSTPSTSLLPSTQTFNTGITNTSSYIALESPTIYIAGLSTQPNLIISGGFGTVYGWQFTRGGTALAAINRINSQNTLDTFYLEVNEGENITLTNGETSITGNFLLNQTDTTTSMGTTQIGYTVENTTRSTDSASTQVSNGVTKNILSFTPAKGVWVVSFNWRLTANTSGGSGTVDGWEICLSATSASLTQYRSFNALRELNDAVGGSGGVRDKGNLSGVINADGSTAYYINTNIRFSGLASPNTCFLAIPMLTYTRIG